MLLQCIQSELPTKYKTPAMPVHRQDQLNVAHNFFKKRPDNTFVVVSCSWSYLPVGAISLREAYSKDSKNIVAIVNITRKWYCTALQCLRILYACLYNELIVKLLSRLLLLCRLDMRNNTMGTCTGTRTLQGSSHFSEPTRNAPLWFYTVTPPPFPTDPK